MHHSAKSFNSLLVTQFLGAFNDNVYKQMILLMSIVVVAPGAEGQVAESTDDQAIAGITFALPFILFSGMAGQLSEKYSKRTIIVLSKIAEIACMCGALAGFWMENYLFLMVVLFLMATQSAFFGPSKYGVMPEIVPENRLANANGAMNMLTFVAIILGTACAGYIKDSLDGNLKYAGMVMIGIAMLGTLTSLPMSKLPAMNSRQEVQVNSFGAIWRTFREIRLDKGLFLALISSNIFWFNGAFVMQAFNNYGKVLLGLNDGDTSMLLAILALGIAVGCMSMAIFARDVASHKTIVFSGLCVGIAECILFFSGLWNYGVSFGALGYEISVTATHGMLFALGFTAGVFSIPIVTYLQDEPAFGEKGKVFAVMNFSNFVSMLFASVLWMIVIKIPGMNAGYALLIIGGIQIAYMLFLAKNIHHIMVKQHELPASLRDEPAPNTFQE
ncbi:MAG: MFS transporter [Planctomycetes bacterium]|nr:MFS transporter [Planctomycetota bacterium]